MTTNEKWLNKLSYAEDRLKNIEIRLENKLKFQVWFDSAEFKLGYKV